MNENDIHKILNDDANLHEAIGRCERKSPPFSADLNDRLLQRIKRQEDEPRRNHVWLYAAIGVVAAGILLLLMPHSHSNDMQQGDHQMVAKQTVQKDSASMPHITPTPSIQENHNKSAKVVHQRPKATAMTPATNVPVQEKNPVVHQTKQRSQMQVKDDGMPYTAETSAPISEPTMRAIQIAPNHIVYVNEAANPIPSTEMPSVNELRQRGQRLTLEVKQKIEESHPF